MASAHVPGGLSWLPQESYAAVLPEREPRVPPHQQFTRPARTSGPSYERTQLRGDVKELERMNCAALEAVHVLERDLQVSRHSVNEAQHRAEAAKAKQAELQQELSVILQGPPTERRRPGTVGALGDPSSPVSRGGGGLNRSGSGGLPNFPGTSPVRMGGAAKAAESLAAVRGPRSQGVGDLDFRISHARMELESVESQIQMQGARIMELNAEIAQLREEEERRSPLRQREVVQLEQMNSLLVTENSLLIEKLARLQDDIRVDDAQEAQETGKHTPPQPLEEPCPE